MTTVPCKDCADRYPGCHGKCDAYKEWRQPYLDEKLRRSKSRIPDQLLKEGHYKGWKKYKKCGWKK